MKLLHSVDAADPRLTERRLHPLLRTPPAPSLRVSSSGSGLGGKTQVALPPI